MPPEAAIDSPAASAELLTDIDNQVHRRRLTPTEKPPPKPRNPLVHRVLNLSTLSFIDTHRQDPNKDPSQRSVAVATTMLTPSPRLRARIGLINHLSIAGTAQLQPFLSSPLSDLHATRNEFATPSSHKHRKRSAHTHKNILEAWQDQRNLPWLRWKIHSTANPCLVCATLNTTRHFRPGSTTSPCTVCRRPMAQPSKTSALLGVRSATPCHHGGAWSSLTRRM